MLEKSNYGINVDKRISNKLFPEILKNTGPVSHSLTYGFDNDYEKTDIRNSNDGSIRRHD